MNSGTIENATSLTYFTLQPGQTIWTAQPWQGLTARRPPSGPRVLRERLNQRTPEGLEVVRVVRPGRGEELWVPALNDYPIVQRLPKGAVETVRTIKRGPIDARVFSPPADAQVQTFAEAGGSLSYALTEEEKQALRNGTLTLHELKERVRPKTATPRPPR